MAAVLEKEEEKEEKKPADLIIGKGLDWARLMHGSLAGWQGTKTPSTSILLASFACGGRIGRKSGKRKGEYNGGLMQTYYALDQDFVYSFHLQHIFQLHALVANIVTSFGGPGFHLGSIPVVQSSCTTNNWTANFIYNPGDLK